MYGMPDSTTGFFLQVTVDIAELVSPQCDINIAGRHHASSVGIIPCSRCMPRLAHNSLIPNYSRVASALPDTEPLQPRMRRGTFGNLPLAKAWPVQHVCTAGGDSPLTSQVAAKVRCA